MYQLKKTITLASSSKSPLGPQKLIPTGELWDFHRIHQRGWGAGVFTAVGSLRGG